MQPLRFFDLLLVVSANSCKYKDKDVEQADTCHNAAADKSAQ